MGRRWGPPLASLILVSPLCSTIRKASGLHPWKGQGWLAELGARDPEPWFWQPFMLEGGKIICVGTSGPRLSSG